MSRLVNPNTFVAPSTAYVGPDGSDTDGDGTRDAPLASLQAALTMLDGQGEIIMLEGDYEVAADVMLNMATAKRLFIHSEKLGRVRVFLGEKVETFVQAGATIRYTATVAAGYVMSDRSIDQNLYDGLRWVFEMDTKDGIITDPHPAQKNKTHRMDHAKLWYHATTGAVEAGNARFTYSGTTLSVSATDGADPNGRTFWIPSQTENRSFVYGGTAVTDVEIEGIEVYFGLHNFDFSECFRFRIRNCISFGAGGEGLYCETFGSGEVVDCEMACCYNDGCGPTGAADGQIRSPLIINGGWFHDNGDEGASSHQAIETTMWGGLYEYNASSGMTHALGASFVAHNPETRFNGYNFTGIGGNTGAGGIAAAVEPLTNAVIHNPVSKGDTVAFSSTAAGLAKTISAITQTGTTVTVTTSAAHGLFVGQKVGVNAVTTSGYDLEGAVITTVPSTTQFTYETTGGLTSPGTVGSGVVRKQSEMTIYNPKVIDPLVRAYQNGTGSGITVYDPSHFGVPAIIGGNAAIFQIKDRRRAFMAIQTGANYSAGVETKMEGFSDATNAYDRSGVFASNRWTPGKIGIHETTLRLVSNTATRVVVYLYKNGSSLMALLDTLYAPYKGSYTVQFHNAVITDYYELFIKPVGTNCNTSQNDGADTIWSGKSLSEF